MGFFARYHVIVLRIGVAASLVTGISLALSWWAVEHPDPGVLGADIGLGMLVLLLMLLFGASLVITTLGLVFLMWRDAAQEEQDE